MRRWAAALTLLAAPAAAQRASDNAVTAAEDAFGSTVGRESIGIYSSAEVRGFSPSVAQNLRIEGLYFDNQAWLSQRLVQSSTVRVAFSALGYPFPAPTGIVDYQLRKPGDARVVSVVGGLGDYAAPFVEVDALIPLTGRLGVAIGASAAHERYYDGADATFLRAAVAPRWRPTDRIEVIPFASITRGLGEEAAPTFITSGAFTPPKVRRRRYIGPRWTARDSMNGTSGIVAKIRIGEDWALAAGAFHSFARTDRNFADVYLVDAAGLATERVVADPTQYREALSGELRLSRSIADGDRLHIVHASLRGRQRRNLYGGTGPTIVDGLRLLGGPSPLPEPAGFAYRARNADRLDQWAAGLAYEG